MRLALEIAALVLAGCAIILAIYAVSLISEVRRDWRKL